MATKRVKRRRPKKKLIVLMIIIALFLIGFGVYELQFNKDKVKENKVVSKIPSYGYILKSNKSAKYKKLFQELKDILTSDKVDEKKYVKKISEMFVVDFYSLDDHIAKTDVGGVDFVHKDAVENFITNAEDTFYKYVESNIYKQRKQDLPVVDTVTIDQVETTEFTYNDQTDDRAYQVRLHWSYKDKKIGTGYQDEATLVYVHDGKKLVLVEVLDGTEEENQED